ncbi:MAG: hypothetical protein KDJ36_00065 [Hyphomicrobiaceae bacterium]|nr:hypothetical protein [Hyphomicrobiaceae bacterium]
MTRLPIHVFFETDNWYCEEVARFADGEVYLACLPTLEKIALENGFAFVTESDRGDEEATPC